VNYTNQIGAFMDWGMEKGILVPFKEQARPMEKTLLSVPLYGRENQSFGGFQ
jgi:predicted RNA-binding protein (virulence factor B family)